MSCGAVCELEATMVYLRSLKEHLKPKLAVSENVANGNINKRIAEALEADMDSRNLDFAFKRCACFSTAVFWTMLAFS